MIRLNLTATPQWLNLAPGLRLLVGPLTTALMVAARADPAIEALPEAASQEALSLAMAKAVARRWGVRSITVNTIEVDLSAFMLGDAEATDVVVPQVPVLGQPALPPSSAVDDVLGLVDMLATPAAGAITGALLVADRGTVMQP